MRKRVTGVAGAIAVAGGLVAGLAGGPAHATGVETCLPSVGPAAVCVAAFHSGPSSAYGAAVVPNVSRGKVYQAGVTCRDGSYSLIYQTGPASSYHESNLMKAGATCRV